MRHRLLFCFIFLNTLSFSQNLDYQKKSIGLQTGIPFVYEKLPEGLNYQPYSIMGYYTITDLLKKKKTRLWLYTEPQLVWVSYRPETGNDFEFGVNLGFQIQMPIGTQLYCLAGIGSGPHYFSGETELQAKGYIFSDNFDVGIVYLPKKKPFAYFLKCRFRHISNAGLKSPNFGIDNWFLVLGVAKKLKR